MGDVLRNSIFIRGLVALYLYLQNTWHEGVFFRAYQYLRRVYHGSATERAWLRLGASGQSVACSRYARFMAWLRCMVERLGDLLQESVFFCLLQKIKEAYLRLSAHSAVLRQINRLAPRQWLLLAFGWYLPLEYLIRDQLQVAWLSSLWEEAFMALGVLLVFWRIALRRSEAMRRETLLDGWLLLFFAVGFFLMNAVQPYPAVALPGYRIVVQYMLWYFILIRLLENDKDFFVLWFSFVVLASFLALHGVYQYINGVEIPAAWVSHTELGVRTRVFSLTGSPNILGSLFTLLAPLCAAGVYYCRRVWVKIGFLLLLCCICLALLFTFSRGAWLGMMLAVVIFSLFVDKRLLALLGAGAAGVLIFVPSITSRITYLFTQDYAEASAVGGRALRWAVGKLLLTENNPWLGFGLGRFGGAVAMNNQILDETEEFSYFYMDNYYLKILVEMGYLGLIAYTLLLLALVYMGIKAIQNSDVRFATLAGDALVRAEGNKRLLAIALFSGMCGVLLHCYFENIFEEPYMSSYFWAMAAMLAYLGFFRKRPASS